MNYSGWILMGSILLGAACTETGGSASGSQGHIAKLPDGVLEIAGPNQDLSAVRIDQVDGCYTYRHRGPVETTYLPLLTSDGRPICSRVEEG